MLVTQVPALRRFWYPVAFAEDLSAGPLARRVLGTDLVVWSADGSGATGTASAALDRCPHRDARLSPGCVVDGTLECPYHGWRYGADGRAVAIPQLDPGTPVPPRAQLASFPATVRHGLVWVSLDPDPVGGIPDLPELEAPGWRWFREFDVLWGCSAPHLVDNNVDPAHVAFVHKGTFGTPERPEVVLPEIRRTGTGLVALQRVPVQARPGEVGETLRTMTNELVLPFVLLLRIRYPDGLEHTIVKACCPVDDGTTRLLQLCARNDTEADRPAAEVLAFDTAVAVEDRAVLETTWPDYQLDVTANVHLKVDRTSIELRRLWAESLGVSGSLGGSGAFGGAGSLDG